MQAIVLVFWGMVIAGTALAAWGGYRLGGRENRAVAATQMVLGALALIVITTSGLLGLALIALDHVPGEDPVVGLAPFFQAILFAAVAAPAFLGAGAIGFVKGSRAARGAKAADEASAPRGRRGSGTGEEERGEGT